MPLSILLLLFISHVVVVENITASAARTTTFLLMTVLLLRLSGFCQRCWRSLFLLLLRSLLVKRRLIYDFGDRSFYTCQPTVFQHLFDVPPADFVSSDFHARLCHVAQNLFTDALCGQRDDWHDEAFKETADHLGEPVAALVVPPDEYGHCSNAARLVAVIVFVELAIFLAVPRFSLYCVQL